MRNLSSLILISIFTIFLLESCTIQKRRYSSGFHITWHKANKLNFKKKNSIAVSNNEPQKNVPLLPENPLEGHLNYASINSHFTQTKIFEIKEIKLKNPSQNGITTVDTTVTTSDSTQLSQVDPTNPTHIPSPPSKTSAGGIVTLVLGALSLLVGLIMFAGVAGSSAGMIGALFLGLIGIMLIALGVILLVTALGLFIHKGNQLKRYNALNSSASNKKN